MCNDPMPTRTNVQCWILPVSTAGWGARFGSGLFLVIQMIILLDFTQAWNDAWVAKGEEDERWLYGLLGLTVTCFAGVLGISGTSAASMQRQGSTRLCLIDHNVLARLPLVPGRCHSRGLHKQAAMEV